MKFLRYILAAAVLMLATTAAFAQGTTGILTGTVTHEGNPLPGATVTISSPSLQGTRTTITSDAGGYVFPGIPPGEYTVAIEMSGMQTVRRTIRVGQQRVFVGLPLLVRDSLNSRGGREPASPCRSADSRPPPGPLTRTSH